MSAATRQGKQNVSPPRCHAGADRLTGLSKAARTAGPFGSAPRCRNSRGEGVTTLAVKLADQLCRRGHKILVVDADSKRDTATVVGRRHDVDGNPWTAYHVVGAGVVCVIEVELPAALG